MTTANSVDKSQPTYPPFTIFLPKEDNPQEKEPSFLSPDSSPTTAMTSAPSSPMTPSSELEILIKKTMESSDPKPLPAMNHKIAAHILGSTFVKGNSLDGVKLEGSKHQEIIPYFSCLLERAAKLEKCSAEESERIAALQIKFSQIEEVHDVHAQIATLHPGDKNWEKRAQLFAEWMRHRLANLEISKSLAIPGGGEDHAMLYEIIRISAETYVLRVYNTGDGLPNHPQIREAYNKQYMQVVATAPIQARNLQCETLWHAYYEMNCDRPSQASFFKSEDAYAWLASLDPDLGGSAMKQLSEKGASFRRAQRAGICVGESLELFMKENLSFSVKSETSQSSFPSDIHQRLRNSMRYLFLCDYEEMLTKENRLPASPSSPAPVFTSEQEVMKQIGILEFLEEASNHLRDQMRRSIRKKRTEGADRIVERTEHLGQLCERIAHRKQQCEKALHTLLNLPAFDVGDATIVFAKPAPAASLKTSVDEPDLTAAAHWHELLSWPKAEALPAAFEGMVKAYNDMNKQEQYNFLNWMFLSMPSARSTYWEPLCKDQESGAQCMRYMQMFSNAYLERLFHQSKGKLHADMHFFAMQKVLTILLRLSENDPVMQGACVDLSGLKLTEGHYETGCFFTTLPAWDQDIEHVRLYLSEYEKTSAEKVSLFQHLSQLNGKRYINFEVESGFLVNSAWKHIWEKMPDSVKETIRKKQEYTESSWGKDKQKTRPPPDAFVLTQSLCSSSDLDKDAPAPSAGFAALQCHLINTLILWNFGMPEDTTFSMKDFVRPRLEFSNHEEWTRRHRKDFSCTVNCHAEGFSHDKIDEVVTASAIPNYDKYGSDGDAVQKLKKKEKPEKEIIEGASHEDYPACQEDRSHQLYKAILYYSRARHILAKPVEQIRLMSLILEPGLLREQLQAHPRLLFDLASFVQRGYSAFSQQAEGEATALFFLRLSSIIETYARAAGIPETTLAQTEFPHFLEEMRKRWEKAESLSIEEREKKRLLLAQEAIAYCGREGTIHPEYLADLLRYHFYLVETPNNSNQKTHRLIAEVEQGKIALALHISRLPNGPLLPSALERVLEIPEESVTWNFTDLPAVESDKGKYAINLIDGSVFIDGSCKTATIPYELMKDLWYELFRNVALKNVRVEITQEEQTKIIHATFTDQAGISYRAQRRGYEDVQIFRILPDGTELSAYNTKDLPKGIKRCVCATSMPWYSAKENQLFFFNAEGIRTHIYSFEHSRLIEESTGFYAEKMSAPIFTYARLCAFDDAAQVWKEPLGRGRIDLPTFGLTFEIDEQGLIQGTGALKGFSLARNQHVRSLEGFTSFLVFENPETKERRVLLPKYLLETRNDFTHFLPYTLGYNSTEKLHLQVTPSYCTFTVQRGKKETLHSEKLADRLYLAVCYSAKHDYKSALDILHTQGKKLLPYTKDELWMLGLLLNTNAAKDKHFKAGILRLKALALFLENQKLGNPKADGHYHWCKRDFEEYQSKVLEWRTLKVEKRALDDYASYCDHIDAVPEKMRLSEEENALLFETIKDQPSPKNHTQATVVLSSDKPVGFSKEKFNDSPPLKWDNRNKLMAAPIERFFSAHARSLTVNEAECVEHFISLYAIARSTKDDAESQEERLRLSQWLCCMEHRLPSMQQAIFFLRNMLRLPRESIEKFPLPGDLRNYVYHDSFEQAVKAFETLTDTPIPEPVERQLKERSHFPHTFIADLPLSSPSTHHNPPQLRDPPLVADFSSPFTKKTNELGEERSLSIPPLAKECTDPFYTSAFEKMQQGVEVAGKEQGVRSEWDISDADLYFLEEQLRGDLTSKASEIQSLKQHLLRIANALAEKEPLASKRKLALQSSKKNAITMSDLELLYGAGGDTAAYKRANTCLTLPQIQLLYDGTAEWLVRATAQQQRRRSLDLIYKIKFSTDPAVKNNLIQKLFQTLSAERSCGNDPASLVLEHRRNMRLRPSQIENIEGLLNEESDEIYEIQMGQGKSDVMAPLLMRKKANGKNLVLFMMTEDLINLDAPKLQRYAWLLYGQKEIRVNWKDTSLKGLQTLKQSLERIIRTRGFVAVTAKDLHDFYLAEQAFQRGHFQIPDKYPKEQLDLFREIRMLLKTHGRAYLDEVNTHLDCTREVLKAIDAHHAFGQMYRDITTVFYEILTTHPRVTDRFYFEDFSCMRKQGAIPFISDCAEHKEMLFTILAEEFLKTKLLEKYGITFDESDRQTLLDFLLAPERNNITLPTYLDTGRDAFSYARGQLQFILPSCLRQLYRQSYGLFEPKTGEPLALLPVPYRGDKHPLKRSQFAEPAERAALAFQSYHRVGIPFALMKEVLEKYRTAACLETESSVVLKGIESTAAYAEYSALLGADLLEAHPKLEALSSSDIVHIAETLSKDPVRLNCFIAQHILPHISIYPSYLRSSGHTIAKMCKRVYGMSGTVTDPHTFHRRFRIHLDTRIEGNTILCLNKAPPPLLLKAEGSKEEQLKRLLESSMEGGQPFPLALIDAGALFKDIPPGRMAEIVLEFAKSKGLKIQSVIYFEGKKRLILKEGSPKPETYSPSSTEELSHRFTLYGQPQTIGVHIDQDLAATALMTTNEAIPLWKLMQGAWRMRGIEQDQRVRLVCPEQMPFIIQNLKGTSKPSPLSVADAIAYAKHIEITHQLKNNCKALFQEIHVEFIDACQTLIDSCSTPDSQKALSALNDLMISKQEESPYLQYGKPRELQEAGKVVLGYRDTLLNRLKKWRAQQSTGTEEFSKVLGSLFDSVVKRFTEETDVLIAHATDTHKSILPEKLPSEVYLLDGTAIQVEQEKMQLQQQDQLVNVETTVARSSKAKVYDLPFIPWKAETFKAWQEQENAFAVASPEETENPFITMTAALPKEQSELFSGDLLLSLNAARYNKSEKPLYGNQKSIEWALFVQERNNPKRFKLILLSREEAEKCRKTLVQERLHPTLSPEQMPLNIALFSTRLGAMNYGDGFYEEGRGVDKSALFSAPGSKILTDFEQLVAQAKYASGETDLFSAEELLYLGSVFRKTGVKEAEELFIQGFLPGSYLSYQKSALSKLFTTLQKAPSAPPTPPLPLPPLPPPSSEEPTIPTDDPPPDNPYGPFDTWKECNILPQHMLKEAKDSCIDWLLANWTGPMATDFNKLWMRQHLTKQLSTSVFDIGDNPQFSEVLDKLLSQR
ncbi:MAG TPA: DUF3638 domain-containing protein [Rhabdochlamydiaceae bacterium]|jgi:hypothetical protein